MKIDTLPENFYKLHSIERNGESLPEVDIKEVVIISRPGLPKNFHSISISVWYITSKRSILIHFCKRKN